MAKTTEPNYKCTISIELDKRIKKRGKTATTHVVSESVRINNLDEILKAHGDLYHRLNEKLQMSIDGDPKLK